MKYIVISITAAFSLAGCVSTSIVTNEDGKTVYTTTLRTYDRSHSDPDMALQIAYIEGDDRIAITAKGSYQLLVGGWDGIKFPLIGYALEGGPQPLACDSPTFRDLGPLFVGHESSVKCYFDKSEFFGFALDIGQYKLSGHFDTKNIPPFNTKPGMIVSGPGFGNAPLRAEKRRLSDNTVSFTLPLEKAALSKLIEFSNCINHTADCENK